MIRLLRVLSLSLFALPALAGITPADFAKAPDVLDLKLSPKGDHVGVVRLVDDKRVLAILTFPALELSGVMSFPGNNQVLDFEWVADDRVIGSVTRDFGRWEELRPSGELFGMDADGRRSRHLFGYRAGDGSAPSQLRESGPQYATGQIIHQLPDDPKNVLIQITYWSLGDQNTVEAAKMNVYDGRLTERVRAPASDTLLVPDKGGEIRFAFSTSDAFESVIHRRDPGTREWSEFSRTKYGEDGLEPVAVDGDKLIVRHAPDRKPEGLYRLDPATGKLDPIYQDEIADAYAMLDDDDRLWGARVDPDFPRLVVIDPEHPYSRLLDQVREAFPGRFVNVTGATEDEAYIVFGVRDDNSTTEFYLYDRKANRAQLLFDTHPWIDDALLGETRPVTITARDGVALHAYLTLPPPARKGEQLPLVLHPHGGPHGPRDHWGFDPYVQVLATHGYAVLQVNFRGSGGYGPHFEKLGFGEWPGKMQDDLTDAVAWAVEEGIADPRRICIYGWSYGGYAALMSAVREPNLYACSVPAAGVYDIDIQYRDSDFIRYTAWGKKYLDRVIGPTPEDRKRASPIHYLDKLETPLFIVHGEADERVPVENARALKTALEKRGTPFEYMEQKNEGHGFYKEENRTEFFVALLAFLDRHIGAPPGQGDTPAGD